MKNAILFITLLSILLSCKEVSIEETDAGVYFRKFGGGVDTTKIFEPGTYSIPNWDYIKTYNTQEQESTLIHYEKEEAVLSVNFSYQLIKEKLAHYHDILGGEPAAYVAKAIEQHLEELDLSKVSEMNDFSEIERDVFQTCTSALEKRGFILLKELKIRPTKE